MRLLLVSIILFPLIAYSDSLVFGGQDFDEKVNCLNHNHPFCSVIRESVSHPLARSSASDNSPEMLIAEKLAINGDRTWIIGIKDSLRFSNKNPITAIDVLWSVQKCKESGSFKNVSELNLADGNLIIKFSEKTVLEDLIKTISVCPVFEKRSSQIFGSDFGLGSNLVSSGKYHISGFKDGKSISLKLTQSAPTMEYPDEVELRDFQTAEEGLSALRAGVLSLFFTEDSTVLEKVNSDVTLKAGKCGQYQFAARRDFLYNCNQTFDLAIINQS